LKTGEHRWTVPIKLTAFRLVRREWMHNPLNPKSETIKLLIKTADLDK
jgi:hypothetical protein